MMTMLLGTALHAATLTAANMCDRAGPEPVGFHSRGFSYVAEVFPAKARRNADDRARVYVYEVGYPGPQWRVDARRLWTATLPIMPQAAIVSMAGDVVMLDDHYQSGGEHSLVVFGRDGRLVRSFTLDELLDRTDVERVEFSDCGRLWRNGTAFYFSPAPASKLYIVFPWGRAIEIELATGALRRGAPSDFATLRTITSRQYPNELTESWQINLRFSSITDMQPTR